MADDSWVGGRVHVTGRNVGEDAAVCHRPLRIAVDDDQFGLGFQARPVGRPGKALPVADDRAHVVLAGGKWLPLAPARQSAGHPFAFRQADQVALAVTKAGLSGPAASLQARDRVVNLESVSLLTGRQGSIHSRASVSPCISVGDGFSQWHPRNWSFPQGVRTVYRNSAERRPSWNLSSFSPNVQSRLWRSATPRRPARVSS